MKAIFDSIPVGLYRTTASGRVLQANSQLAELLGCESVGALLRSNVVEFYANPADRARAFRALDRHGATHQFETILRRRDGTTFWAEVFGRRIDDGPEVVCVGTISDISARKRLEAQADRFTRAAAASGEIVFMTDPTGTFTYLNPEFTRVYGYQADELIGKHTPRILKGGLHPEGWYETFWQDLLSGRSVRREFTNRRKDGSLFLIDASANPITDESGTITGFLAIQRDITARRRTENALHESEALFRRIFDQLPVGAALLSTERQFHRANAAFCTMMGRSEAELRGMTPLDITHPEDREKTAQVGADLLGGKAEQFDFEKRYVRKDGAVIWGACSVRPIKDADGRSLWTMPVVIDITERRRLEQQLRQAQKMEAVGQLAGGIAHDFNNILTVMLGYCDLALANSETRGSVASDLQQIQMAAQRAAAVTRQLLAFSRKQVLRLEVIDLSQVLEGFQRLVRPIIGEDINLRFDLSPTATPVLADAAQLEQVAMNLLVNARDAMPQGGTICVRTATVSVESEEASLHEASMAPGDYVQFVVEDTGHGMSEDTKRHVFEPFFTTKPSGTGTGLGLAVVYGIVRQMGGFIWVYSEKGRGTAFKIYFPRAAPLRGSRTARPAPTHTREGHERILLVEDDREVRAYAGRVLRRSGYEVAEAGNGVEALAHLKEAPRPDLVITDMVMPGMSGPELAQRLREQHPGLGILFTSGYLDHRIVVDLEHDVELLEKPFTPGALLDRVRHALDQSDQQPQG